MKEYIAIYHPAVILSGIITETGEKGTMDLPYSGISGSYTNAIAGMTVLLGSSYNSREYRLRLREATSSLLDVAENDYTFVSGTYFSIIAQWDLYPVYPFLDYEDEDIIEYKDRDIAYDDQNTNLGIIPIAGSHAACFVNETIHWSASGSVSMIDSSLSYQWTLNGTVSGSSSVQIPGDVAYPAAGNYYTRLQITDENAFTQDTFRYVTVIDKTNLPYSSWGRETMAGSRNSGGWMTNVWLRDYVGDVNANDVVIIFTDDDTIPHGNQSGRSKILLVGYVEEGTIQRDWASGKVIFTIASANSILKKQEGYGISLVYTDAGEAEQWYQMDGLSIKRGLYEYLKWNTTIFNSVDVRLNFTDVLTQYFDTAQASIWDALSSSIESSFYGDIAFDRLNTLYIEYHPARLGENSAGVLYQGEIARADWMGTPEIAEIQFPNISYLEVGGMLFDGGETILRLAGAPGNVPGYFGSAETIGGLSVGSMAELLQAAANIFASKNAQYPNNDIAFSHEHWNWDIAPVQSIGITIAPGETPRALNWDEKECHIAQLDIERSNEHFRSLFSVNCAEMRSGTDAEEIILPPPDIDNIPELPWPVITGTFLQPRLPIPDDPTDPIIIIPKFPPPDPTCMADFEAPPNGPFNTGIVGMFTSMDFRLPKSEFNHGNFWARTASHENRTKYVIHGKFEKLNAITGLYEETTEDTFYTLGLLHDDDIVSIGDRDALNDPRFRTGVFTGDANEWVNNLRLFMNTESSDYDGASAVYKANWGKVVTYGPLQYSVTPENNKKSVRVKTEMITFKPTSQYIIITINPVSGKSFADGYFYAKGFCYMQVLSGTGYYYNLELSANESGGDVYDFEGIYNTDDNQLVYADFDPILFHFDSADDDIKFQWSATGPRIKTLNSPYGKAYMDITFWRAPTYRITIYGIYLYNICVRSGGDIGGRTLW